MLSLDTAKKLKAAGLEWTPAKHDFFYIPVPDLDEQVYVISDMSVIVEGLAGDDVITFNGVVEWALDSMVVGEAVWIPREEQLRGLLEKILIDQGERQPVLTLTTTYDGYACSIQHQGTTQLFEAFGASEAYGAALLHVIEDA